MSIIQFILSWPLMWLGGLFFGLLLIGIVLGIAEVCEILSDGPPIGYQPRY